MTTRRSTLKLLAAGAGLPALLALPTRGRRVSVARRGARSEPSE